MRGRLVLRLLPAAKDNRSRLFCLVSSIALLKAKRLAGRSPSTRTIGCHECQPRIIEMFTRQFHRRRHFFRRHQGDRIDEVQTTLLERTPPLLFDPSGSARTFRPEEIEDVAGGDLFPKPTLPTFPLAHTHYRHNKRSGTDQLPCT